jgi:hypothetical protein
MYFIIRSLVVATKAEDMAPIKYISGVYECFLIIVF